MCVLCVCIGIYCENVSWRYIINGILLSNVNILTVLELIKISKTAACNKFINILLINS